MELKLTVNHLIRICINIEINSDLLRNVRLSIRLRCFFIIFRVGKCVYIQILAGGCRCRLYSCRLYSCRLYSCRLYGCRLYGCRLYGCRLYRSNIIRIGYTRIYCNGGLLRKVRNFLNNNRIVDEITLSGFTLTLYVHDFNIEINLRVAGLSGRIECNRYERNSSAFLSAKVKTIQIGRVCLDTAVRQGLGLKVNDCTVTLGNIEYGRNKFTLLSLAVHTISHVDCKEFLVVGHCPLSINHPLLCHLNPVGNRNLIGSGIKRLCISGGNIRLSDYHKLFIRRITDRLRRRMSNSRGLLSRSC